jgi:RNA polymerase sigma factor CnrH
MMANQDASSLICEEDARALCTQAAAGDRLAYGALMRQWQTPLWRLARRYTGDAGEAEDIVQTVFVAFWLRLTEVGLPNSIVPFLRRATLNACHDWARRRAVRSFFFRASPLDGREDIANPVRDSGQSDEALVTLDIMIAQLPRGLKEPLILCAIEGVSHKDAGVILGLTSKAIEARIARAKKLLLKLWPDQSPL